MKSRRVQRTCPQCGIQFLAEAAHVNRAQKIGAPLFCGKPCAHESRRIHKPDEQKKAEKAAYDRKRREKLGDEIRAKKRSSYYANHEVHLARQAEYRKANMHKHVEYCRRPEYKEWKSEYDRRYRAKKDFGEFAEAALLLQDIKREVDSRATRYEIYLANGTINKAQTRRRAL